MCKEKSYEKSEGKISMKERFDYVAFAKELKEMADSLKNQESEKYEENLKRTSALLEKLFENVLRPAMSEKDFCLPEDIDVVARVFHYIYSTFDSPREKLILLLGESLVYETFGELVDLDNGTEETQT